MNTKAEDIFADAIELDPAARPQFLEAACAGDRALRTQVEQMLGDWALAARFFEGSRQGLAFEEFSLKEGESIGPYTLRQKLGEGGFGEVWMAEQRAPLARMVALKVIKAGLDTREFLARFEAERQALARMDHPNIARVLDGGATRTGRPYFAMELVRGIPITRFCDQERLGTKERLALFREVCSAVAHAHQKGVIHRDIKPANVLVTLQGEKPVPKVIDFGIAKAVEGRLTERTLFTRFEQFLGTPAYMSPEQASLNGLDIDTRADVYGLGVLLYELLVGKPPLENRALINAGYDEMRRIIREVEPAPPSIKLKTSSAEERRDIAHARDAAPEKIGRLVESDLDLIVLKAIDKDRARRYATADDLAADVGRFLANEPVTARRPSAGYLFWKFAKRHSLAIRVAAAILVLLIAATVTSAWLAIKARNAEMLASKSLAETRAERDAKDQALDEAESVTVFLSQVFSKPDPYTDGRSVTVAESLDAAAKNLESDLKGQPLRQAKLMEVLASSYAKLGIPQNAKGLREKVLEIRKRELGPGHRETQRAMDDLAHSCFEAGDYERTIALRTALQKTSGEVLDEDQIVNLYILALAYERVKKEPEAMALRERALELSRKLFGPEAPRTLDSMKMLAYQYRQAGRTEDYLRIYRELLAFYRKKFGPDAPETLEIEAGIARAEGRPQEVATLRARIVQAKEKQVAELRAKKDRALLGALLDLAPSYRTAKRLDAYEATLKEALDLARPTSPVQTISILSMLANFDIFHRPAEEILDYQHEAVELSKKVFGEEHRETLQAMSQMAYLISRVGSGKYRAIDYLSKTVSTRREQVEPNQEDRLLESSRLAFSLFRKGNFDESLSLAQEILPRMETVFGPNDRATQDARSTLARCETALGRTADGLQRLFVCGPLMRDDTYVNARLAGLQVWRGDNADYESTRSKMLERISAMVGQETRPHFFERITALCCLRPITDPGMRDRLKSNLEYARGLYSDPKINLKDARAIDWVEGVLRYRCGEFEAAEQIFAKLKLETTQWDNWHDKFAARIFHAMAVFRLGRQEEARAMLRKILEQMRYPPDPEEPMFIWRADEITHWIALREARELMDPDGANFGAFDTNNRCVLAEDVLARYPKGVLLHKGTQVRRFGLKDYGTNLVGVRVADASGPAGIYAVPVELLAPVEASAK